jgi:hypothetical protein
MKGPSASYLTGLLASEDIREQLEKAVGKTIIETIELFGSPPKGPDAPAPEAVSAEAMSDPMTPPDEISEALQRAAISYNYQMDAVRPDDEARAWLLRQSVLVSAHGSKHLRLFKAERERVLNSDGAATALASLLAEHEASDRVVLSTSDEKFENLADAYLREFIRGRGVPDERFRAANHRRAIAAAREELDGVNNLSSSVPSLLECRRRAGIEEILTPLGIMIGVDPSGAPGNRSDRFVGRVDELRSLREVIDELDSHSVFESASRGYHRLTRRKPRLLTIVARGGLGKSALMAKFLYDHATLSRQQFPFAYLDFDRSDIQPRGPGLMLLEICRQLSFQYSDAKQSLDRLSEQIRLSLAGREAGSLLGWCQQFRTIVRATLDSNAAATFLLVLDTMEIVDADPEAMNGVVALLRALTAEPFAEMCVVAAGRSGVEDLSIVGGFEVTPLKLQALSVADARVLVDKLGKSLLSGEWNEGWSQRIAGLKKDPESRREPLSLRLAVEMVRDTAPELRESVVDDIRQLGERAGDEFVAALYERRILDHIRDKRARKLAWPGLVARRVTRQMAREVLAPICELDPPEAEEAFDILSREGWIVDHEPASDSIRHRRDLRARTLPLMRHYAADKFNRVIEALLAYYVDRDPLEHAYYLLLRGDEKVYSDQRLLQYLADLAPDVQDFEPGSPGWNLIQAKFANRLLELDHMRGLPDDLLWEHLSRTGSGLRGINDRRIEPRVQLLIRRRPPGTDGDILQKSAWQAIQIKCGLWSRLDPDQMVLPPTQYDLTQFAFYVAQLSLAGERTPDSWVRRYPQLIELLYGSRGNDNWHALTLGLVTAGLYDPQLFAHLDSRLVSPLAGASGQGRMRECSLRVLMQIGIATFPMALSVWAGAEMDRLRAGIAFAEYAVLVRSVGDVTLEGIGASSHFRNLVARYRSAIDGGSLAELPRWLIQEDEAVADAMALLGIIATWTDRERVQQFARRYISVRQPEWIVPFAYLLNEHLPANWHERAADEFSRNQYDPVSQGFLGQIASAIRRSRMPSDVIEYLTLADRAGDFDGTVRRLCEMIETDGKIDVQGLNSTRTRARQQMLELGQQEMLRPRA